MNETIAIQDRDLMEIIYNDGGNRVSDLRGASTIVLAQRV